MPFLAVLVEQQVGYRVRLHARGVAHAIDVPLAILAGDAVGMAAGHDMQDFLLGSDLSHRLRDARVHIADDEVRLVALDELAGLLHAGADVIGRVFDQELDRAAENAALRVDLLDRELGARHLVLRNGRVNARQRIDHADADRRVSAR